MTENIVCSSCKRRVANMAGGVTFQCPGCSKSVIVRCADCRKNVARYKCHECGFEGPN